MSQRHRTVDLTHPEDGVTVSVDEDMAPLVAACWRAGIDTSECCQEDEPGLARLSFLNLADMERFHDVVTASAPLDEDGGWSWRLWTDGGLRGYVLMPRAELARCWEAVTREAVALAAGRPGAPPFDPTGVGQGADGRWYYQGVDVSDLPVAWICFYGERRKHKHSYQASIAARINDNVGCPDHPPAN
jgi:hypothetical protein